MDFAKEFALGAVAPADGPGRQVLALCGQVWYLSARKARGIKPGFRQASITFN